MFRTNITVNGKRMRAHKRIRCYECKPHGSQAGIHASTMGLQTPKAIAYDKSIVPTCNLCGINLPPKTKATNGRKCSSCANRLLVFFRKRSAIEYKGGKCQDCGCVSNLTDDVVKFDFHHLKDKEFAISDSQSKGWKTLKNELDKCLLLCANCHRMRHTNELPDYILNEVALRQNPLMLPDGT